MSIPRNLVLGCGKSCRTSCSYGLHFTNDFYTVDIDDETKPDKILDIQDKKSFQETFKGQQFSSIIFELLPKNLSVITQVEYWKQFLKEDGVLVYINNYDPIMSLPEDHAFFTIKIKELFETPCLFIIPKSGSTSELKLSPELHRYITKNLHPEELKHGIIRSYITPELKQFISAPLLKQTHAHHIFFTQEQFLAACIQKNSFSPQSTPTLEDIRQIVKQYTPGKARQFFCTKTKGMKELDSYLLTLEDKKPISTSVLLDLMEIIKIRNYRTNGGNLGLNLNPTRNLLGSTQKVFFTLYVYITRHLMQLTENELNKHEKGSTRFTFPF